ncbi:MAG: ribosome-associated translation inhibitor RaiA [Fusobacteria bacterium]|nr:ribosome-associated translation inhibitor RaiA [Fusobacteriota bacterium]
MKVNVRGKGLEVTNSMENYIQEKANNIMNKYFSEDEGVEIQGRMKIEKLKHFAEITMHFHSYVLRGEAVSSDMYNSIDGAFKNIESQYIKHKERLTRKNSKINGLKATPEASGKADKEEELEVIRRKKFTLKPMNEEEAIMQMELLGHNFYVYLDDISNNIQVAYKRKEGFYGIIETEK